MKQVQIPRCEKYEMKVTLKMGKPWSVWSCLGPQLWWSIMTPNRENSQEVDTFKGSTTSSRIATYTIGKIRLFFSLNCVSGGFLGN